MGEPQAIAPKDNACRSEIRMKPGQASVTDNTSSHRSSRSLWTTRFGRVQ